jgi:cytochrome oxidase Cu insertion factor (SCO1/SenC/PrrC family)/thiol-disulfide isomerase/thioredoxin
MTRTRQRLLLGVLGVAVALAAVATAVLAFGAPRSSARLAVVLSRDVSVAAATVSDLQLTRGGGATGLASAAVAVAEAPDTTDLGVQPVPADAYTGVSAVVDGHLRTASLRMTLRDGALLPLLVVVTAQGIEAHAGNDDVNHGLLAAAGKLVRPPDVAFTDQAGRSVPLRSLRGRVVVVAALDTHCHDTCPLYTAMWADLQRVLRERGWTDRVSIAEVSMDPDRDTPEELAAYARMTGAGWPLLRSDPAATLQFWSSLGAAYVKAESPSPAPLDWYTGKPEQYHLHHDSLAVVFDAQGYASYTLQGNPRLGHALPAALQALMDPSSTVQSAASWGLSDLLDKVDVLLGAPAESDRGAEQAARSGAGAPDFTLSTLDGASRVSLHQQRGRATVVTLWATWCTPCRHDMPLLAAAVRKHPDVSLLAVDEGEDAATVRSYLSSTLGADSHLLTTLLDPDRSVGSRYAASGLPVTVFVGADGVVQAVRVGQLNAADVEKSLLASGA